MDIAVILRELDAEIEKLKSLRRTIAGPVRSPKKKPSRKPLSSPVTAAEPLLTKVPPKLKREYRPRVKSVAQAPIALAAAPSDRKIIAELEHPVRSGKKKPSPELLSSQVVAPAEPLLTRLPSKPKREYRPRVKSIAQAPIALAVAPSDRPVFVPRAALSAPVKQSPKSTDHNPELLQATFRKNLLSGAI